MERIINKVTLFLTEQKNYLSKEVLLFFGAFFLYFMYFDSIEITLPLFFEKMSLDMTMLGSIFAVSKLIRSVIVIPISMLRKDFKFMLLTAFLFVNILLLFLIREIGNSMLIVTTFVMLLVTTSVFNVVLNPILAEIVPKNKIGLIFGMRDVFLYGGGFVGLIFTAKITREYGYEGIFLYYIIIFILLIISINTIKNRVIINAEKSIKESVESKDTNKREKMNTNFIMFLIVISMFTIASMSMPYIPLYGLKIGLDESNLYYLFSSSIIISSILALIGGIIIDKVNKKKLLIIDGIVSLVIFLFFMMGNPICFMIGIVLTGLGTMLDNTTSAYLVEIFSEEMVNRYWGTVSAVSLISSSIGVFMFGLIYKIRAQIVLPISFVITVFAILMCFKLKEKR